MNMLNYHKQVKKKNEKNVAFGILVVHINPVILMVTFSFALS